MDLLEQLPLSWLPTPQKPPYPPGLSPAQAPGQGQSPPAFPPKPILQWLPGGDGAAAEPQLSAALFPPSKASCTPSPALLWGAQDGGIY